MKQWLRIADATDLAATPQGHIVSELHPRLEKLLEVETATTDCRPGPQRGTGADVAHDVVPSIEGTREGLEPTWRGDAPDLGAMNKACSGVVATPSASWLE